MKIRKARRWVGAQVAEYSLSMQSPGFNPQAPTGKSRKSGCNIFRVLECQTKVLGFFPEATVTSEGGVNVVLERKG